MLRRVFLSAIVPSLSINSMIYPSMSLAALGALLFPTPPYLSTSNPLPGISSPILPPPLPGAVFDGVSRGVGVVAGGVFYIKLGSGVQPPGSSHHTLGYSATGASWRAMNTFRLSYLVSRENTSTKQNAMLPSPQGWEVLEHTCVSTP